MKRKSFISLLLAILISPIFLQSQNIFLDGIFEKYSNQKGFTYVNITPDMFDLFSDKTNTKDSSKFMELVKGLTGIKVLTYEKSGTKIKAIYEEVLKNIPKGLYKELMVVKSENTNVKFLIHKENNKIMELVLLVSEENQFALISITGDIDLKKVKKLSKQMNIKGLDNLDDLKR